MRRNLNVRDADQNAAKGARSRRRHPARRDRSAADDTDGRDGEGGGDGSGEESGYDSLDEIMDGVSTWAGRAKQNGGGKRVRIEEGGEPTQESFSRQPPFSKQRIQHWVNKVRDIIARGSSGDSDVALSIMKGFLNSAMGTEIYSDLVEGEYSRSGVAARIPQHAKMVNI